MRPVIWSSGASASLPVMGGIKQESNKSIHVQVGTGSGLQETPEPFAQVPTAIF